MQDHEIIEEYMQETPEKEGIGAKMTRIWHSLIEGPYYMLLVCLLIACTAFFIGYTINIEEHRPPVRITQTGVQTGAQTGQTTMQSLGTGEVKGASTTLSPQNTSSSGMQIVASKSGTKYHYTWCAGAKQISDKNKIYFSTPEEARAKGYTPATNCKGLK